MIPDPSQVPADADRSVARTIADVLSQRIVGGMLKPGTRLRQDHIAAEFRASHVPVREAFRTLESQGLIIRLPRRGVRVAPLDPAAIHETTQMRAALEVLALRHAMPLMSAVALDGAEHALNEGEASADIAVWEAANRRFHNAISAPCAMPRLLDAIGDLQRISARFLYATWEKLDWQPRSAIEHRDILTKVRQGDIEAACAALDQHIKAAGAALVANLL